METKDVPRSKRPFPIVEGRSLVDRAARPDVFVRLFRQIEERGQAAGGPMFGDSLGVPVETIARGGHGPLKRLWPVNWNHHPLVRERGIALEPLCISTVNIISD
jgi:hypothetical protein